MHKSTSISSLSDNSDELQYVRRGGASKRPKTPILKRLFIACIPGSYMCLNRSVSMVLYSDGCSANDTTLWHMP
jgi:hypothetical protein